MPWTSTNLWTAAVAIVVWGACGWGVLVPQQHRPVTLAPQAAPVVLGLNTSCTYFGVAAAGVIGAAGIKTVGPHDLGIIGAVLIAVAFLAADLATRRIRAGEMPSHAVLCPAQPS